MRPSGRKNNEMRDVKIDININKYAEGSCLIKMGNTHILCTASVEEKVPHFIKGKNEGWLSAEYSMLPRSTHTRMSRDNNGKQNGRALEIQRLIGRSLRSTLDFRKLGERQITIDCDVIQADGGTRCASITGGFVALSLAVNNLLQKGLISENPIKNKIAAVSCGVWSGEVILDLDYDEDSKCAIDSNFVLNYNGDIIEIQATAERDSLSFEQMTKMHELAKKAMVELFVVQAKAIGYFI